MNPRTYLALCMVPRERRQWHKDSGPASWMPIPNQFYKQRLVSEVSFGCLRRVRVRNTLMAVGEQGTTTAAERRQICPDRLTSSGCTVTSR